MHLLLFGVIRDEIGIVVDVATELLQISLQLAYLGRRIGDQVEAIAKILQERECATDTAVPKMVFYAFEHRDGRTDVAQAGSR